ncbi:MAG: DsbA family protein [Candidatus Dormibacteria bacterium]
MNVRGPSDQGAPRGTPEPVVFHFDPICPWAWITSRWAVRLEELGQLSVEWRLFSLGVANASEADLAADTPVGHSGAALAALALARRLGGNPALLRLYTAMGDAAHQRHQDLADPAVLDHAWAQAGQEPRDLAGAAGDPSLWASVLADHRLATRSCQAFGVPTLILDGGSGPGIFGPIITEVPSDEECVALLSDVVRMMRRPFLMELKRDRPRN